MKVNLYLIMLLCCLVFTPLFAFSQQSNWKWVKSAGSSVSNNITYESAWAVVTDSAGFVYTTGTFQGTASFDNITVTSYGNSDVFIAKYRPDGSVVWVRSFGGAGFDQSVTINLTNDGYLFIGGDFSDSITLGSKKIISKGQIDGFIAKFDTVGNPIWARSFGDRFDDWVSSIVLDSLNNFYVSGKIVGDITFGPYNIQTNNVSSGFVAKYDSAGIVQWVQPIIGSATNTNQSNSLNLALSSTNEIVVTGLLCDTIHIGSLLLSRRNTSDPNLTSYYIAKLSSNGTPLWAKSINGKYAYSQPAVKFDIQGNIFFTVGLSGTIYLNNDSIHTEYSQNLNVTDVIILKLNSQGSLLWSKAFGGMGGEISTNIIISSTGIYIIGIFGRSFTLGTATIPSAGVYDSFVAFFDLMGNEIGFKIISSPQNVIVYGATLDQQKNLFISGYFQNTAAFDTLSVTSSGGYDLFLAKLSGLPLSVKKPLPSTDFDLYPNPATDFLTIGSGNNINSITLVKIKTISGQVIHVKQNQTGNAIQLDIRALPAGMYLIEFVNDNYRQVKRFIKQ